MAFLGGGNNNASKEKPVATTHFDTLISSKSEIIGDLHFSGGLHIDGKVYGNIVAEDDSKSILRISEKGAVEGEISAPHVVVNGAVTGDIHACEHLELASKAIVNGDVYYNTIEMIMGSQVNGALRQEYRAAATGERPQMPKKTTKARPKQPEVQEAPKALSGETFPKLTQDAKNASASPATNKKAAETK
ncbi:protein CcmA, bactofilin family [Allopseudospirillum japonicum]|uniref:Protein CcmA, bactofilin family n=1 Tax=Allopseudospirillum japonicum TaxID=64971 RepID=A0A1H6TSW6_9GAMM|nr:polymer-forming cytoskeletal protein [Allopseudospirillum japonicum]SEI81284.1 protein CcmA, bactofilin family [Allopseudospirillum japonicum]